MISLPGPSTRAYLKASLTAMSFLDADQDCAITVAKARTILALEISLFAEKSSSRV
jgi:hypothetical protein